MPDENVLETSRLTLRALTVDDGAAIVAGIGAYEVVRWLVVVPYPYTDAEAVEFLARVAGRPDHWAILHQGLLIGIISHDGELGYWLAKPFWGQGFASEAVRAVLGRHFADPAQDILRASHLTENTASARVLAKAGFIYTGERIRKVSRATGEEVESLGMALSRAHWQKFM